MNPREDNCPVEKGTHSEDKRHASRRIEEQDSVHLRELAAKHSSKENGNLRESSKVADDE